MYKIIAIRACVSSYTINITNLLFFVQPLAKNNDKKSRSDLIKDSDFLTFKWFFTEEPYAISWCNMNWDKLGVVIVQEAPNRD